MNDFGSRPTHERAEVFEETAARRGIGRAAIVEKDFWVCWTLAQLYGHDGPSDVQRERPALLFKGGTSLSKAYGLINRFSEDVDLTVDRKLLVTPEKDPDEDGISTRERKRRIDAVARRCEEYVAETIAPFLRSRTSNWKDATVTVDDKDLQTLHLGYPRALPNSSYGGSAYVNSSIRLEFGARGELWPAERRDVTSYAAEEFPNLFSNPTTAVWVLSPRRTLWEKATILHAIAASGRVGAGERQSRHYADLALLAKAPFGVAAVADTDLLLDVAQHKSTYFSSASARYDLARPGSLRLVPSEALIEDLQKDYERMSEMFITDPPPFSEVIEELRVLERRINETSQ
jgi:hypothetical protein